MEVEQVIAEYRKKGFVIDENNRVLCATSRLYARFSALGKVFAQERDPKGKMIKYVWTLVTKEEAMKLKTLICPEDNKASIKFAYIPTAKIPHFNMSLPIAENEVEEVEVSNALFAKKQVVEDVSGANLDNLDNDENDLPTANTVTENDVPDADPEGDDLDEQFDDLEKSTTEETPTTDGGLTARNVEEKELMEKEISEIRTICTDLGIEFAKNANKKSLVNKILG